MANLAISGTPTSSGTVYKNNLQIIDTTSQAAGVGGGISFRGNYSGTTPIDIGSGISGYKITGVDGGLDFGLNFWTRGTSAGVHTSMFITGEGNVGIGTTGPLSTLHIGVDASSTNATSPVMLIGTSNLSSPSAGGVGLGSNFPSTFTGSFLQFQLNNSTKFSVSSGGTIFTSNGLANSSTLSNAYVNMLTTGTVISRNITGAGVALTVSQTHASATGDILDLQNSGGTVVAVQQNGNVGIGTTSPATALHVVNNGTSGGAITLGLSAGTADTTTLHLNRVGTGGYAAQALWENSGTAKGKIYNANEDIFRIDTGTGVDLRLMTAGSDRLTILSGGNVGIGTVSPSAKLEIATNGAGEQNSIMLSNATDASGTGFAIKSHFAGYTTYDAGGILITRPTAGATSAIAFRTNTDWTTLNAATRMYINEAGNVGIGTTAPASKLHIVQSADTALGGLYLEKSSGGVNWNQYIDSSNKLNFAYYQASKVTIDTNGNVGIGTTAPGAKLDIQSTNDGNDTFRIGSAGYYFGFARSAATGALSIQGNQSGNNNIVLAPTSGSVGIGTTGPGAKLQIGSGSGGTTDYTNGIQFGDDANARLYHYTTGWIGTNSNFYSSASINSPTIAFGTLTTVGDQSLIVATKNGYSNDIIFKSIGTSPTESMRITSSGNVGIGTTAPGNKLTIIKDSLYSSAAANAGLALFSDATASYDAGLVMGTDATTHLSYIQSANYNSYTNRPLILQPAGGNVGIGLTNPTNTLETTGTFSVSQDATNAEGTGGTITHDGSYTVHTFTSGTATFSPGPNVTSVAVLVVAGGGGGGNVAGGGGGGGGVVYNASYAVTNTSYTATVGGGGAAQASGSNSVFGTITAVGGGRGGWEGDYWSAQDGGSGGAGSLSNYNGAGTAGQGYGGGSSCCDYGQGGGGGAGGTGGNGAYPSGGNGGAGVAYSISGTSKYYGGGGGGGAKWNYATAGGHGGSGVGGEGQDGSAATAGAANTGGGGGGGGGGNGGWGAGAAGGSGVVIVRYLTPTGVSHTKRLLVDSAGNVGVGTTAPSYKLDVNGAVNATSVLINGVAVGAGGTQWASGGGGVISYTGGSVGIGTTSPVSALQVIGNGIIVAGSGVSGNQVSGEIRSMQGDTSGTYVSFKTSAGKSGIFRSNTDYFVWYDTGTGDTNLEATYGNSNILFKYQGAEKMRITSLGNVGIGTTTPSEKLHISGSSATGILEIVENTNTGTVSFAGLRFKSSTGTNGEFVSTGSGYTPVGVLKPNSLYFQSFGAAGDIGIFARGNDAGSSGDIIFNTGGYQTTYERMRINSSGNVGIGTTGPGVQLHVLSSTIAAGTPGTLEMFKIARPIAGGVSYPQAASLALGTYATTGAGDGYLPHTRLDFKLKATAADDNTTGTTVLTLQDNGNVGIGTTAPAHKLDVSGNSRVTGASIADTGFQSTYTYPIYVPNMASATGLVVKLNANGYLYADASSESVKQNIERGFHLSPDEIIKFLAVEPIKFEYLSEPGVKQVSFSADEMNAAGISEVVSYKNGKAWGLNQDGIMSVHHTILANHEKRLTSQQTQIENISGLGTGNGIAIQGNVGIGITNPTYKLQVNGQPAANGYTAFTNYSDSRLKENVVDLVANNGADSETALEKIAKLHPVTFNYNSLTGYDEATRARKVSGFIAQELQQVFPEMVGHTNINGTDYLDTNLSDLPLYLVKGVQELNLKLNTLAGTVEPIPGTASEAFATAFFNNVYKKVAIWLSDASNGLEKIFVKEVDTKSLCLSDDAGGKTCVTKTELDSLLATAGVSGSISSPPLGGGVPAGNGGGGLDPKAPVITLNGEATVALALGELYSEQGATVTDDVDTSVAVIISGSVDNTAPGIYTITYNASDSEGNKAIEVKRTVNVGGFVAPEPPAVVTNPPAETPPAPEVPAPSQGEGQGEGIPPPSGEVGGGEVAPVPDPAPLPETASAPDATPIP